MALINSISGTSSGVNRIVYKTQEFMKSVKGSTF